MHYTLFECYVLFTLQCAAAPWMGACAGSLYLLECYNRGVENFLHTGMRHEVIHVDFRKKEILEVA